MTLPDVGKLAEVEFPPIPHRPMYARPGTSDRRVIEDACPGYHLPPPIPPPAFVLDVGANIGVTAAHYQHLWPDARVVAVEMDGGNVRMLRRNAPDAVAVHAAVASVPGVGYYDRGAEAEAFRLVDHRVADSALTSVACVTLESLIGSPLGGHADFVKLDVEGAEWELLAAGDAWAPLVSMLLVELHAHGAPDPPAAPWPEGRDGQSPLLAAAIPLLEGLGFVAVPHVVHPAAVWAIR